MTTYPKGKASVEMYLEAQLFVRYDRHLYHILCLTEDQKDNPLLSAQKPIMERSALDFAIGTF